MRTDTVRLQKYTDDNRTRKGNQPRSFKAVWRRGAGPEINSELEPEKRSGLIMTEVSDGLLVDKNHWICKARTPSLLPEYLQTHYLNRKRVKKNDISRCSERVLIYSNGIPSKFNNDLIEYVDKHEATKWFLSNVALSGKDEIDFPLVVEYKYGVIVVAPEV